MLDSMDCLLAIDTLGVNNTAAILTIALLRFNLDSHESPSELLIHVDPDSNAAVGRSFEAGALRWWSDRPDLREVFAREEATPLENALDQVRSFYHGADRLWTMVGGVETAIVADAYQDFGQAPPWKHWEVSCGRTLCDLSSWLAQSQVDPTPLGDSLLETAHLRLEALRAAYSTLSQRADRRVAIRS